MRRDQSGDLLSTRQENDLFTRRDAIQEMSEPGPSFLDSDANHSPSSCTHTVYTSHRPGAIFDRGARGVASQRPGLGKLAPAFWGRQVENTIPETMMDWDFEIEHDRKVRQGFYPSRVMVARK